MTRKYTVYCQPGWFGRLEERMRIMGYDMDDVLKAGGYQLNERARNRTIHQWRNEEHGPRRERLDLIADLLHCDPDEIAVGR